MTESQFRAWLKEMGWTQAEAARKLGMGPRQVWKYANGKADIPRTVALALACAALYHRIGEWG